MVNTTPGARPTYWLTRFLILRLLGLIYAVAFLVAIHQIVPLIGANGLLPVGMFLDRVADSLGSRGAGFLRLPSLFWFGHSDSNLLAAAWIGFVLSCVVIAGYSNGILLAVLWILYMSFVHVGQDWYGYGWEIDLSLSAARHAPLSETGSADFYHWVVPMADFPDYAGCRTYQDTR
jgi:hypothetical protein